MDRSGCSSKTRLIPLKSYLRRKRKLRIVLRLLALAIFGVIIFGISLFRNDIYKRKQTSSINYDNSKNDTEGNIFRQKTLKIPTNKNNAAKSEEIIEQVLLTATKKINDDQYANATPVINKDRIDTQPTNIRKLATRLINKQVPVIIPDAKNISNNQQTKDEQNIPKRILLWTTLYADIKNWQWWFESQNMKQACPHLNCVVSSNRNTLNDSDVVLFHVYSDNTRMDDLPGFRKSNQHWVFFTIEPPEISAINMYKRLNGLFNWTMTYRFDSDIPLYYGTEFKVSDVADTKDATKDYTLGKTKRVVWFVSHCPTDGRRESYVKELEKYIEVDSYGDCGNKACTPKRSRECYDNILGLYKFYLAFENILCKDYITEKLFNILAYPIVPVVFGGGNYSALAPPKSFIDAYHFPSPKDLAEYLKMVDENDSMYNEYFDWKRGKKVSTQEITTKMVACGLCSKIHAKHSEVKIYNDLYNWWYTDSKCETWINNSFQPIKV